jgi:hypothetical protein
MPEEKDALEVKGSVPKTAALQLPERPRFNVLLMRESISCCHCIQNQRVLTYDNFSLEEKAGHHLETNKTPLDPDRR